MVNAISKFNGSTGVIDKVVTALADDGTATINLSTYADPKVDGFVSIDASGNVAVASATTFSVVYNSTTKVVTFTNLSTAAFTGTYRFTAIVN